MSAHWGDLYDIRDAVLRAAIGRDSGWLHTGRARREALTIAWLLHLRSAISTLVRAGSALVALASDLDSMRSVLILLGADAIMLIAGLTACYVPLRRALRIDPTEALRAEA